MSPELVDSLQSAGLRLLVALAVLVVGRVLAAIAGRLIDRMTNRPNLARNLGPSMRSFFARAVSFVITGLAVIVALYALGVPEQLLVWVVGIALVILGLSLQHSISNLAATVIFVVFQPFKLGDDVETMGQRGVVEDIQLFNTVIRRFDHTVASLPNGQIQASGVLNHSHAGINWAPIDFTVSYETDLGKVRDLVMEVLHADERVLDQPPPDVVVLRLGSDGVVLQAQPTVRHADLWPALSHLQDAISTRLSREGIPLAVPPETPVRIRGDSADGTERIAPGPAR